MYILYFCLNVSVTFQILLRNVTALSKPLTTLRDSGHGKASRLSVTGSDAMTCWNRYGLFLRDTYEIQTCRDCYFYLLNKDMPASVTARPSVPQSMDKVCRRSSRSQCQLWRNCCEDAMACCTWQQDSTQGSNGGYCPMTWDGFSCVNATPRHTVAEYRCPEYLPTSNPEDRAFKTCSYNSTWWRPTNSTYEMTDYSACGQLDVQGETAVQIVSMTCSALSIAFLLPAIFIFIRFRSLRRHRHIKLHINLCVSLLLSSLTSLLMVKLVYLDSIYTDRETDSFQEKHQTGCTVLVVLDLLFQTCPVCWMVCEGFHLAWLMLRSFQPLKTIYMFYLFGWGLPMLVMLLYVLLMTQTTQSHSSPCWLGTSMGLTWIFYGLIIACIAVNLVLFLLILKVLLTEIQSHPNEPSNFRKALKATVVLIPLFGLQQFGILYSPDATVPGYIVYDIVRVVVIYSQGFFVALIFCFCNTEVHTQIRLSWSRWRGTPPLTSRRTTSSWTSSNQAQSHRPSLTDLTQSHRPSLTDLTEFHRPSLTDLTQSHRPSLTDLTQSHRPSLTDLEPTLVAMTSLNGHVNSSFVLGDANGDISVVSPGQPKYEV